MKVSTTKTVPIEKAKKVLHEYQNKYDFNAYQTLINNGYSEKTSRKQAKQILNGCMRAVAFHIAGNETPMETKEVKNSLAILGVSEEEVKEKLKEIAFNKRDYTNALKVLTILAKDVGIDLVELEDSQKPVINIGVEKVIAKDSPKNKARIVDPDDSVGQ